MLKKLADVIAGYISEKLQSDMDKTEIFSYGLQILLGTVFEIIAIIIVACFLNILKSTLIVFISFVMFRRLIGGTHCSTYNHCFFASGFTIIVVSFLGAKLILQPKILFIMIGMTYIFTIIQTIVYIPMGTEKKMIKNTTTRLKIKIQTMILLNLWIVIIIFLQDRFSPNHIFSSLLGVIAAFFFSTPFSYRIINSLEVYLNSLMKGGHEQNV
ncbi:accessory gene regulator ArgB-like protein [Marinisporobacter balticus]|uniref:Accessory gene regulator protein AgrB n=1 Tax=Marinisporobacter balticus TaxID=2018667 RepID=A0A4R2KDK4_9FIRM|nr:accessory gene regulator B family protein [Marinisporobacter balticus]TCO70402.1 accessory gene regulator protein AgrB [Marinisporobacter balticus]